MSKPKFNIDDEVFYVTSSCHYGKSTPCPVCYGKRKSTVILGNEERVEVECGYCSHGIDGPSGYSKTWEPEASIKFGTVKGVSDSSEGWQYSISYDRLKEHEIFLTREEAEPLKAQRLAEEQERRKIWERDNFIQATKKQIWSAGYHRNRIAEAKRTIAWHEMRLCMIKEKE